MDNWIPIEGTPKQRRTSTVNTFLSKKRADHRNAILKDWAERIEPTLNLKVPEDYISPFDTDKCIYCLSSKIGKMGDEFRPTTQRGRQNKINCVPCCGPCNSSKQDKCGSELIKWIKSKSPVEQYEKIIKWYQDYEKYMLIPEDTIDIKYNKLYMINVMELDSRLNSMYEDFS